jgi:hypothetical protein
MTISHKSLNEQMVHSAKMALKTSKVSSVQLALAKVNSLKRTASLQSSTSSSSSSSSSESGSHSSSHSKSSSVKVDMSRDEVNHKVDEKRQHAGHV